MVNEANFPRLRGIELGFLWVRDGSKGISLVTKDVQIHVASPAVAPFPEDRAKMVSLIGVKESR
jgi:hypothetical protein